MMMKIENRGKHVHEDIPLSINLALDIGTRWSSGSAFD